MSAEAQLFNEAQQRSIGVCVSQLREHLGALRGFGIDGAALARIGLELDSMATATGARRPQPPRNALNATFVQMLVLEEELRPRRMTAYGELSDDAARLLDGHVQRLVDLTQALITQTEGPPR
jgi:hypothetical protein